MIKAGIVVVKGLAGKVKAGIVVVKGLAGNIKAGIVIVKGLAGSIECLRLNKVAIGLTVNGLAICNKE